MTQLEMRALVDELNRASVLYYTRGDSPMSDAEWDQKYNQLLQMEKESGMVLPDSPSHRVGAEPLKNFEQHKHISRLWSMGKVQSKEELRDWIARTEKLHAQLSDGREEPLPPLQYAVEYKLDGLTINLTYDHGQLIQAATRGNGVVGEAILPQARTIRCVPLSIPWQGLLEIQGECIMRLSVLEAYNKTHDEPLEKRSKRRRRRTAESGSRRHRRTEAGRVFLSDRHHRKSALYRHGGHDGLHSGKWVSHGQF